MTTFQIHAGNHKTGSTAIQRVLREMRPRLARKGILMPGLQAHEAKHGLFFHELMDEVTDRPLPHVRQVQDDVRAAGSGHRHILTNETFIGLPPELLRAALAPLSPDNTYVYFYVRPHAELFVSLYLQAVKNGQTLETPEDFVERRASSGSVHFIPAIESYGAEFGEEAVFVREFSRTTLRDGSIISDFWEFLDLPKAMLKLALAVANVANPTPKAEVAEMLRSFGVFLRARTGRELDDTAKAVVFSVFRSFCEIASDLPGTPYRLATEFQERLAETHGPARKAFADRWFHRPPSANWLAERIQPPLPPVDPPFAAVETVVAHSIARNRRRDRARFGDLAADWLQNCPTRTEQGVRVIAIDGLVDHFAARGLAA